MMEPQRADDPGPHFAPHPGRRDVLNRPVRVPHSDGGHLGQGQHFRADLRRGQPHPGRDLLRLGSGDYNANSSTPDPYSTITVTDPNWKQVAYDALNGLTQPDPNTGAASHDFSVEFRAATTGSYEIEVADNVNKSYTGDYENLSLRPIALDTSSLNPNANAADAAKLSFTGGGMYASLNGNSSVLTIAGPTGRGFQLQGQWTETTSTANGLTSETYQSTGNLTLETNSLLGNINLPLGNLFGLQITTYSNGWGGLFGEVDTTQITGGGQNLSSLIPFQSMGNMFGGLSSSISIPGVSLSTPGTSWGIALGSSTLASTLDNAPLDPAVPYLYVTSQGAAKASFGSILAETSGTGFSVAVDPQDPSFYLDLSNIGPVGQASLMFSQHGQIPYTPIERPTTWGSTSSLWGDAFIRADISLASLTDDTIPLDIEGDATINWDPSGIGATKAISNMFNSGGSFVQGLQNVQFGLNGTLSFAADFEVASGTIPMVYGSLIRDGAGDFFFAYASADPLKGTSVASYLESPVTYDVNGFVNFGTGEFYVNAAGSIQVAGTQLANGDLELTDETQSKDTELSLYGQVQVNCLTIDLPGVSTTVTASAVACIVSNLTTGTTSFSDSFSMNGTAESIDGDSAAFSYSLSYSNVPTYDLLDAIGDVVHDTAVFIANSLETTISNVDALYEQLVGSVSSSVINTVSNDVTNWIDSI